MRNWVIAVALVMGAVFSVLAQDGRGTEAREKAAEKAGEAQAEKAAGVQFLASLDDAKKQAKAADKKLFIVFSTSWCGPCKQLQAKVWDDDNFAVALAKTCVALKLDGDLEREAVKSFEVRGYPTVVLCDSDGKVLARQVGAAMQTGAAWETWISEKLGHGSQLEDLIKAATAAPQDLAKVKGVADALWDLGRKDEAAQWYDKAEKLADETALQIKLRKVEALLIKRKDDPTIHEVMGDILPRMMAKKDERVIDISFNFANLIARMAEKKDPAKARKLMQDLAAAFPEHKKAPGMRCMAGMYAHLGGDNETALAEMKKIAEDYKDSDDAETKIWVDRCHRFIKTLESGDKYR
ncbi:MAG: thioredoxin family protein [Planctomycetes bacterium]|nr:thioredoxin family protein [Planctomycetota bacterium]MCW8134287.1 thioredoxin family protein [Planctomycetota bacterium]